MEEKQWRIHILGVRGSMAVTQPEYQKYGGDTVCVRAQAGETVIFLDAGTGILYGEAGAENYILIGHPHLDHLIGLCKWGALSDPLKCHHIFLPEQQGKDTREVLDGLIGPPYWPIHLDQLPARTVYHTVRENFRINDVRVELLAGAHPGGVTHYKLTYGGKSLVYAVDSELTPEAAGRLAEFAKGCDLLICDGQLAEGEQEKKRGWGHSTVREAARTGRDCGAGRTVVLHFDPAATDEQLELLEQEIKKEYPECELGKQGECICL